MVLRRDAHDIQRRIATPCVHRGRDRRRPGVRTDTSLAEGSRQERRGLSLGICLRHLFGGGSLSDVAGVGSQYAVRQCGARGRILRAVCRAHVGCVGSLGTKEKQKTHLTARC